VTGFIQISTTLPERPQADEISRQLIDQRLAACVQVSGPQGSHYRWQGKIEHSEEWLLTAKARAEDFAAVAESIRRLHPYEVPEIIAVEIAAVSADYQRWLVDATDREQGATR